MPFFLVIALCALVVALVAIWTNRVNAACMRNVVSVGIDCDIKEAREDVRQLTADIERMNELLLQADRRVMGLKVHTMEARGEQNVGQRRPPRELPPTPAPAKKKTARKP